VCDRVAIVDHGRVVQEGKLEDLLTLSQEIEIRALGLTEALLAALPPAWKLREHQGDRLVLGVYRSDEAAEVVRFLVAHGVDLLEMRPRRTNLEDLFLQWVEGEEGAHLDVHPADPARSVA
jgi:ABC-2 type transport system ATP-binding protein